MKTITIQASYLISFQRQMRAHKQTLIRAIPFTDGSNNECYRLMYVE